MSERTTIVCSSCGEHFPATGWLACPTCGCKYVVVGRDWRPQRLSFDGQPTEHPARSPRRLSERQRELVAYMRQQGVVRPREIGVLMHAGRSSIASKLEHASSDGYDALRRLERRGLVERIARGRWHLVEHDESWPTTT